MPTLKNPNHERYAQARAAGNTIDRCYELAGYTPNRGNAARLNANERVQARVSELLTESAIKVTDEIAFDVKSILTRIANRAEAAARAGDHKTAMDGEKFIAACFGYADSPTLTHELMKTGLLQQPAAAGGGTDQPNVLRFADSIDAIRRMRDRYDR